MNVVWSPQATDDLASLHDYIARDNPNAASAVTAQIIGMIDDRLRDHPNLGRPGRVQGTRELVVTRTPFIVPYRIKDDVIEIVRVYHASRRWPDSL